MMMENNELEKMWPWPNYGYYTSIFLVGPRKTAEKLGQNNHSLGQNLNPVSPKYKAGVSTTRP